MGTAEVRFIGAGGFGGGFSSLISCLEKGEKR